MDPKTQTEVSKEAKKFRKEDLLRNSAWKAMVKTEGWRLYQEFLTNAINAKASGLFEPTPPGGRDAEQHQKGAIYGMIWARDIVPTTIAAMGDIALPAEGDDDDE